MGYMVDMDYMVVDTVDMVDCMVDTTHTAVTIIVEDSTTTPFTASTVTILTRYTDQTTSNNLL